MAQDHITVTDLVLIFEDDPHVWTSYAEATNAGCTLVTTLKIQGAQARHFVEHMQTPHTFRMAGTILGLQHLLAHVELFQRC